MKRRNKLLLMILIFLLQLPWFAYLGYHRFVDGDEGFYLVASRLILLHKTPYIDFLYTQAPLLPYVYGGWMKLVGVSWIAGRMLAVLLTTLLGVLLIVVIYSQTGAWIAACAGGVLFTSNVLVFAWLPIVKTYSLAAVFLFGSYLVISRISDESKIWLVATGGLLFGLSVGTRSYLILLLPLFLVRTWRNAGGRAGLATTLWFTAGLGVSLLPCMYLFLCSPGAFLFNNLGYHALRTRGGLVGLWGYKLVAVLRVFLDGGTGLQTAILFFVSVTFVFSIFNGRSPVRFALQTALAISIISLLPTPVYEQYFSLAIPFFVVGAVCAVAELAASPSRGRPQMVAVGICLTVLVIYVASAAGGFYSFVVTGHGVPGQRSVQQVLAVSRVIEDTARHGEEVASFWPGYVFQTTAVPASGFESDFGFHVAEKLSPGQRAKYHILSLQELQIEFAEHRPRIAVIGNEHYSIDEDIENAAEASLLMNGYVPAKSIANVKIYECCAHPSVQLQSLAPNSKMGRP